MTDSAKLLKALEWIAAQFCEEPGGTWTAPTISQVCERATEALPFARQLIEENERLTEEREQALNEPSRILEMCQEQNRHMSRNIEHLQARLEQEGIDKLLEENERLKAVIEAAKAVDFHLPDV